MTVLISLGREAFLAGVLPAQILAARNVDAVNLVASDIAVHPLDFRSQHAQNTAGGLRNGGEWFGWELSAAWEFAFHPILGISTPGPDVHTYGSGERINGKDKGHVSLSSIAVFGLSNSNYREAVASAVLSPSLNEKSMLTLECCFPPVST
jgi:hypothetical protein